MRNVRYWFDLFTEINNECDESEYVPLSNVEYYTEQIWNLTGEGDLSIEECEEIAFKISNY